MKITIAISIDDSTAKKLDKQAGVEKRSRSNMAEFILLKYLGNQKPPHKKS